MKAFDIGKLFSCVVSLANFAQGPRNEECVIPYDNYLEVVSKVNFICDELERMGLAVSLVSARMVQKTIRENVKELIDDELPPGRWMSFSPLMFGLYSDYAEDLAGRVADELSVRRVLILPSDKACYFDGSKNIFPDEVRDSFQSAEHDMDEARKCFALGRHTAAVFHLMRIMEAGLSVLGLDLGLNVGMNWNTALDQIEKEIRSRSTKTHGLKWKTDDEPFYSETAAHFRFVKNAWRNHVVHKRNQYDKEKAEDILNNVSAFMRHLAGRLHE
jgi:hypothetical protein